MDAVFARGSARRRHDGATRCRTLATPACYQELLRAQRKSRPEAASSQGRKAYLVALAAEDAAAAAEPAAAEAEPAAAEAAPAAASAAGAGAGAGAGVTTTGAGAGAGAGSSFLPQAARAAAATRAARTIDLFISGFLQGDGRQVSGKCPGGFCTASDRVEKRFPAQPTIIAIYIPPLGDYPRHAELYRPSVVAGNAGVALRSHSARLSRQATRRSGSLPQ